ncbi:MAG: adenylate/guanylate cyclase domain-containing protein [Actinobacteria bacterium]|nr:adenylate/guanylate cyclase domain-containing protein [Actinomycetota bacterium]
MSAPPSTSRRTFLFTDIESSTRMWDQYPDAMLDALDLHDQVLVQAVSDAGGDVIRHTGDGIIAVFRGAATAVRAALAAQRGLGQTEWPDVEPLRVRMGIHSGDVLLRGGEHHGWALNFTSRLHALAHGGQVVVSGAAMSEVGRDGLPGVEFIDLGLHHLRDVAEPIRVYGVTGVGVLEHFDGLRDTARRATSVPRPRTSFIGRAADVDRVAGELQRHQVVTITGIAGIAGIGKTRLSLEVASLLSETFTDGVVMTELTGVSPAQVGAALAKSLGVERRSLRSADESVVEWLRDKRVLLLLDSCEDASDAVRELVHAITLEAAGCKVLATSHEPLDVEGEQVSRLLPLDVGAGRSDAVELFFDRARGAGADFDDSAATLLLVQQICRSVDGLPLAIEIAASNAGSLALLDILDAVKAGELPGVTGSGTRRRSVVDALELAFGRLDPASRDAFVRCSVFAGSFDRAAFAAVAAPALDGAEVLTMLRSLVDRSLITSETRRDRTRFRLLEPVRAFAEHRCRPEELASARSAFLRHYCNVAERAGEELRGPDEAKWVSQIELDFDNLRAAHGRGLSVDGADVAVRIVAALWDFAFMRMRSEIFDWGEAAADRSDANHPLRAMVLGVTAMGYWLREQPAKAAAFAEESLRLERDTGATRSVPARMALMNSAEYGGMAVDVRALMAEVLDVTKDSASPYWQVNADVLRVLAYSFAGRPEQAQSMASAAMMTARRSENPSTIAWALFAKGMAVEPTDSEHAEALYEDGLERSRSVENGWIGAMCTTRLASLRRRHGGWADAMMLVRELFDTWGRAGHRSHLWSAVRQAALCLADAGDAEHAAMLHRATTLTELHAPQLPTEAQDDAACLERAKAAAAPGEWVRWEARGADLDQLAAVQMATARMELALRR